MIRKSQLCKTVMTIGLRFVSNVGKKDGPTPEV